MAQNAATTLKPQPILLKSAPQGQWHAAVRKVLIEFMAAEAMRIQVTARYPTEVREAVHRLDSQEEAQDDEIWPLQTAFF